MEVKSVSESSISNVKLSRSEKKEMKKQRKRQAIENVNAESKEKEISLGTDAKLCSEANVSLDSRLQGCEDSVAKDGYLGIEQLACPRRKRKKKENCLVDEKQSDSVMESKVNASLESGLNEEANSLMKDTLPERDSNVDTVESIGLETGLKESCLNEQPAHSERKRKRRKERKEGPESVVELRDRKENSLIDEKQSDSHLESGLKEVQLKEQQADLESKRKRKKELKMAKAGQFEKSNQKSVEEVRDAKENSLIDEKQSDSHLESGLKGVELKVQPADLESRRKWKKELKLAKARQSEKSDQKSVVELRNGKENSLIDEKQSDSCLESGMKGVQLKEQPADSESKRKRKELKMAKARQFQKLDQKSIVELRDEKENSLTYEKQSDSNLESGMKGVESKEQPADSERKRKRKKELKVAKARQFEKLDQKSVAEVRDGKDNSLIDEKQSDSHLESGLKGAQSKEQPADLESKRKRKELKMAKAGQFQKLDSKSVVELRDRKENSLIDEKQSDSHLESRMKGVQLKEQPADSESKRKRKKELKMAKAGQFEKWDQKSVEELRDEKENSLIDEKQIDSHLESGMKGIQLKEQPADSEGKRKRKKELKMEKARQSEKSDQKSVEEHRDEKENSLIDEKQSDSHLESGMKWVQSKEQPADSEGKRKRKELKMAKARQFEKLDQKSVVELRDKKENSLIDEKQSDSHLVSGMKGVQLKERSADSESKRKRKKELKMAKARQFEKLDQKSVVEVRDGKENSLIDEKQCDSWVDSKLNVSLELGLKEGENSLMKDTLFERYSHMETLEKYSLESGFKGSQWNEQPTDSKRKSKRKREHKMAKAKQFKKLDATSVLELRDSKENSLIDEKQSDCHVKSKASVSLESGLKEGANSDLGTLENISLESGLKGTQLNEQTVQSERKIKREREKRKKRMLNVLEDKDISTKRNYMDSNKAEKNNVCPEPQIIDVKDYKKEDLMSTSENAEAQNMEKTSLIPVKQSDSPQNASTSMVETPNLHVDWDLIMPDIEVIETFQIGKTTKTYHRKKKKSSDLLGDSLEPVREISMIQTSIDQLEKEHSTSFSENRSDGVLVGHAMPAQVLEEAFGSSTGSEAALNGRERQKRKKLKESLCKYPDQKHVEIETKKEELIPSLSNLAVAKDDVAVKGTVKENNLSRTLYSSLERICTRYHKKKLFVLDLNGILVDVVQNPGEFQPDTSVSGKGVFKRPFCDDFLHFCFMTFNVGIWSSRINKNVNRLVSFLVGKWRRNLLFCWTRNQCTITKFNTIEDEQKPLVLKELRKLWDKHLCNLPWEKGEYDESNTLLLDDSPYKALRNPANTAIFPYPFQYRDAKDSSLGHGRDIRKYLEGLAASENVQKYVEQNPFGQPAITESDPHWDFYRQIIDDKV